jgi:hypothetical protein
MKKIITAEIASVETAVVALTVIRINNKQMTLAVFRQLQKDSHITGPVWGQVNYHPDKCSDDWPHLHLIWQKNDELRRAVVYEYLDPYFGGWQRKNEDWDIYSKVRQLFIAL